MTYLILAILFSTAIVITFKLFERFKIDNTQAITANYLLAAALGFIIFPDSFEFAQLPERPWFPWAMGIGVSFILVFFLFALSAQKVGLAITAVSSKMSVVIPVSVGIFLYHDQVNALKIIGIVSSIAAFYLTFKQDGKARISKRYLILPALLFLGNGTNDTLTKHSQLHYVGTDHFLFLSSIFSMSLFIGIFILLYHVLFKGMKLQWKNLFAGFFLGALNFGSSYYFLRGLFEYESSVFFPVFNVSIVSLSALSGLLLFRERLRFINWFGILLAVIAILLISFS